MSASTSFSNPDTNQTTISDAYNQIRTTNNNTTYSLDDALNTRTVNVTVTGPAGSDQLGGVASILGASGDAVGGTGLLSSLTSGNKLLYLGGAILALAVLVFFLRKKG